MLASTASTLLQFQKAADEHTYISSMKDMQGNTLVVGYVFATTHEDARAWLINQDPCLVTQDSKINCTHRKAFMHLACKHDAEVFAPTRANKNKRGSVVDPVLQRASNTTKCATYAFRVELQSERVSGVNNLQRWTVTKLIPAHSGHEERSFPAATLPPDVRAHVNCLW